MTNKFQWILFSYLGLYVFFHNQNFRYALYFAKWRLHQWNMYVTPTSEFHSCRAKTYHSHRVSSTKPNNGIVSRIISRGHLIKVSLSMTITISIKNTSRKPQKYWISHEQKTFLAFFLFVAKSRKTKSAYYAHVWWWWRRRRSVYVCRSSISCI